MSRSWREWSKHRSKTPRNWSSVLHCCKMHHESDARAYDELRDLREGKREHLKQIDKAIKGGYARETAN